MENRAILLDSDFKELKVSRPTPTDLLITAVLTREAAARMVQETGNAAATGGYLAMLVGSRLVSAARLMSVIGDDPDLPIFMGLQLPESLATATAARIARRWPH